MNIESVLDFRRYAGTEGLSRLQRSRARKRFGPQPWLVSVKGLWLAALLLGASTIASGQTVTITEYATPTLNSQPTGITAGPDGALWFTETDKIGRITTAGVITEYPALTAGGSALHDITVGPDGALWFTELNKIGRITTAGAITEYPLPMACSYNPVSITAGPDGALWFAWDCNGTIGRMTTAGVVTLYGASDYPLGITAGPDGAVWFTEGNGKIGRITMAGVVTEYTTPTADTVQFFIITGPDGALWFTEYEHGKIGRITTAGVVTEYNTPTAIDSTFAIASGPDGAVWFTGSGSIGRITTAGAITVYPGPAGGAYNLTTGSDGALWFTETYGPVSNIGRASITGSNPSPGRPTPSSGSGSSQTFVFTFSDPAGWQDLDVANILIDNVLDGRNSCYLAYSRSAGVLYLVNDPGTALSTGLPLNGAGGLGNSQCSIIGVGSSAAGSGNTLTLTLDMSFSASFAGNKVIYLAARDLQGNNSGWQALGTWDVPGVTPSGPSVKGMSPANTNGLSQTYVFTFNDTNGWQDIAVANVLINSAIDGRHACFLAFVPTSASAGSVFLVDDAGDAAGPYSGVVLPGPGSASNAQCAIAGAGSSVSTTGNTLTLTLAVTFTQSFAGNQIIYAAARSLTVNSGWQAVGSVTVP